MAERKEAGSPCRVDEIGPFSELVHKEGVFKQLMRTHDSHATGAGGSCGATDVGGGVSSSGGSGGGGGGGGGRGGTGGGGGGGAGGGTDLWREGLGAKLRAAAEAKHYASAANIALLLQGLQTQEARALDRGARKRQAGQSGTMSAEDRSYGSVSPHIYRHYLRSMGGSGAAAVVFVGYALGQAVSIGTRYWPPSPSPSPINHSHVLLLPDPLYRLSNGSLPARYWLSFWSEHSKTSEHGQFYYLAVYGALAVVSSLFLFTQFMGCMLMGIKAARKLFDAMVDRVLRAPMHFFDTTPQGRIVNRFSKDVYSVDEQLPGTWQVGGQAGR
jgi:hypothetical protein